ncbi:MAG: hypothetical protein JST76_06560, partial [Bacteroidetes bacterium]|nr:hypothetical protein [Bacteroidota bacterium]
MESTPNTTPAAKTAQEDEFTNPLENFNLGLFLYVLNKSVVWIIVVTIVSVILSWLYIHYSPNIYQSNASILFITANKEAQILGVEKITQEQDQGEINREIKLIQSPLIAEKVYNKLPLRVAYFKEGRSKIVSSDLYLSSPFRIEEVPGFTRIENEPIYITIINQKSFSISYNNASGNFEKTFNFGDLVVTPLFRAYVKKNINRFTSDHLNANYFFKFMDKGYVMRDIMSHTTVNALDPKTKLVTITYEDKNQEKTRDVTEALANEFIEYDIEKKRESFSNILRYVSEQIDSFSLSFAQFEDSISNLRAVNGFTDDKVESKLNESNAKLDDQLDELRSDLIVLKAFRNFMANNVNHENVPIVHFRTASLNFDDAVKELNDLHDARNMEMLDVTTEH